MMHTACVATTTTTSQGPPWLSDPCNNMKNAMRMYNKAEWQTTHKSLPVMRSTHSNHPQMMTTHHNKKRAQPHMKNEEHPSLTPMNNGTKWAQMTTTAHHQPTSNKECPLQPPLNDKQCTSTTHEQWLPTTQNVHDHPQTTRQWHGTSIPITSTGVHALHPGHWLSDPRKAAWQCPLRLALLLQGSWVISGAITLCRLGYLWVFINPLPVPAKTHTHGRRYILTGMGTGYSGKHQGSPWHSLMESPCCCIL